MSMPCRDVLKGSQKDIQIEGPLNDPIDGPLGPVWQDVVVHDSDVYWRPLRDARAKANK